MRLLSKVTGTRRIAIFDVGAGSVAASIVELRGSKPARIHAALRRSLAHEERSESQLVSALKQVAREAGEQVIDAYVQKKGSPGAIDEALIILHAPWVRSHTAHAREQFAQAQKVAPRMLAAIAKDSADDVGTLDPGAVFEKSIVRVALNGYPTANPIGHRAREVVVTALQSDDEQGIGSSMQDIVHGLLPGRDVQVRSATFISAVVLRGHAPRAKHYCIADVTSEATAFTAVRDGLVTQQATVPVGMRTILRDMVAGQGEEMPIAEVQSLLRMYARDACSSEACERIEKKLKHAEPQLTKQFGEVLSSLATDTPIPNTLILIAHPDIAPWLAQFLTRVDFSQFTVTGRPFSVRQLLPKHLTEQVLFAPGVLVDSGIALAAAFVNTHGTRGE